MQTYEIPRNYKGESRILYIFSIKALVYTAIWIAIGLLFNLIFKLIGLKIIGIIITIIFGLIGFIIGTLKIPDTKKFEFTEKTGGENIDDIIIRAFRFKKKKNRIYVYTKEDLNNE